MYAAPKDPAGGTRPSTAKNFEVYFLEKSLLFANKKVNKFFLNEISSFNNTEMLTLSRKFSWRETVHRTLTQL